MAVSIIILMIILVIGIIIVASIIPLSVNTASRWLKKAEAQPEEPAPEQGHSH